MNMNEYGDLPAPPRPCDTARPVDIVNSGDEICDGTDRLQKQRQNDYWTNAQQAKKNVQIRKE